MNSSITIHTLENIKPDQLLDVCNGAFSDYYIPVFWNQDSIQEKILREDIDLKLSVGAFCRSKCIGFILHGIRSENEISIAYNAGTGVLPESRGYGLTVKMYDFIFPVLKQNGIQSIVLEVINENKKAIHIYNSLGFEVQRQLSCYKGDIVNTQNKLRISVKLSTANNIPIQLFGHFHCKPSWQNELTSILKLKTYMVCTATLPENGIAGFIIYHPANHRVYLFGVLTKYRRLGIATELFKYLYTQFRKPIRITNVDQNHIEIDRFLQSLSFHKYLHQSEMVCII